MASIFKIISFFFVWNFLLFSFLHSVFFSFLMLSQKIGDKTKNQRSVWYKLRLSFLSSLQKKANTAERASAARLWGNRERWWRLLHWRSLFEKKIIGNNFEHTAYLQEINKQMNASFISRCRCVYTLSANSKAKLFFLSGFVQTCIYIFLRKPIHRRQRRRHLKYFWICDASFFRPLSLSLARSSTQIHARLAAHSGSRPFMDVSFIFILSMRTSVNFPQASENSDTRKYVVTLSLTIQCKTSGTFGGEKRSACAFHNKKCRVFFPNAISHSCYNAEYKLNQAFIKFENFECFIRHEKKF